MSNKNDDAQPAQQSNQVWDEHANRILGVLATAVIAIGTVAFRLFEDWSWVDAFYFSVVTATTVGFGDLSPSTDASKLFSVLYIACSLSIITLFLNQRLKHQALGARKRHKR